VLNLKLEKIEVKRIKIKKMIMLLMPDFEEVKEETKDENQEKSA
jgi:hypothetical protein